MKRYDDAIKEINPDAYFDLSNNDLSTLKWLHGTLPIELSDIETKATELETKFNNEEYKRNRKAEYPLIEDQLDEIYHNGINGWKETIKAVKDKYPKE